MYYYISIGYPCCAASAFNIFCTYSTIFPPSGFVYHITALNYAGGEWGGWWENIVSVTSTTFSFSAFFLLFRSLRRFQLQYLLIPGFQILFSHSEFQVLSIPKPYRAIFFGYACYGTGAVLHFLLSAFARKSCCSTADSMNRLCDSRILEFFSFLLGLFLPTALLCCCDSYGWEIPTQYYTQQIFLHKNVAL